MAAHDNINAEALLSSIHTTLAAVPTQTTVQQEILQLLTEIQHSNQPDAVPPRPLDKSRKKEQHPTGGEDQFKAWLRQAFYEQLPTALHEQWQMLFQRHAALLQQELFRHGQTALVRRRIAVEFTDPMFADLLRLLEPSEARFLENIVFHPILSTEKEGIANKPGSNERLREFTLAYLLTERGSHFNKKTYLTSLLTRMAAHDNLKVADVMQSLTASLTALQQQSSPAQQEMLKFLKELGDDGIQQRPRQSQEATALLRSLETYEWLSERIKGERELSSQEEQRLASRLHELLQQYPALLERLFAECSNADLARFLAVAPMPSVQTMISTLIRLRSLGNAGGSAEFLKTMEKFAGKSTSPRAYYRLLAKKLRAKESIDFEELLRKSSQEKPSTKEEAEHEPIPAQKTSSPTQHPALARLLALLRQRGVRKELIQATERYAARAGNINAFCDLIIDCLKEDLPIDFEEILAQSRQEITSEKKDLTHQKQRGGVDSRTDPTAQQVELDLPAALAGIHLSEAEKALARLLVKKTLNITEQRELAALTSTMLQASPARLRFLLENGLASTEKAASRLADSLPESQLTRIFLLLRPRDVVRMQRQADQIALACATGPFGATAATVQRLKKLFLSRYLLLPDLGLKEFLLAFTRFLQVKLNKQDQSTFLRQLRQEVLDQEPHQKSDAEINYILAHEINKLSPETQKNATLEETNIPARKSEEQKEDFFAEEIYLENAGLVLVATYMDRLFKMLGLLEQSSFKDTEAAERAVHLLQYLVEERCDRPEYLLVLNKILCGIAPEFPLIREIEITDQEKQTIDGLLAAVIQHWGAIGKTSVAGLREAFLQREGYLRLQDDAWHLRVEEKAYDMLLDRLPWSFSLIKLPWMERALHVQWR